MNARPNLSILLDDELNLRSGWRLGLYVAVFVIALYGTGALISLVIDPATGPDLMMLLAINAMALGIPAVVALAFMKRFVDQVPLLAFGVGVHERWPRDLLAGLGIGSVMLAIYLAGTSLTGDVTFSAGPRPEGVATDLVLLVAILAVSAANEELVFRGYPLQVLMYGIGRWPAFLLVSALFGLGHHLNPNATWVGTTNTALAGILLCLAYARTRSLWFPYGIHIGWNLGIGPIFGFPLSGMSVRSLWVTEAGGPSWLTGGAFGPEGGVLVTGIMISAAFVVGTTQRIDVSPSVNSVLARHPMKVAQQRTPASPLGTGGT